MDTPIVKATSQAGVLSALSNVLAQLITCWQLATPWRINVVDVFQFVLFSVLVCPPNYIWQSWLEAQFPADGGELVTKEKEASVERSTAPEGTSVRKTDASRRGTGENAITKNTTHSSARETSSRLNKKNTAIKFALDQTLGAGVNTVLFIAGMGLIRGESWDTISSEVHTQFWPMIFAGQKFWPLVSVLCFALVPLEQRMLVGNTAGLFWGIYLSLISGSNA